MSLTRSITRPISAAVARASDTAPRGMIGPDLVVNGGFATDTVWTKGAPWTISSGVATCAGTGGLSQAIALSGSARYRITFTITAYTSGGVRPRFTGGTTVDGTLRSAAGTYTEFISAAPGNTTLVMSGASFSGAIDNVSLRMIS